MIHAAGNTNRLIDPAAAAGAVLQAVTARGKSVGVAYAIADKQRDIFTYGGGCANLARGDAVSPATTFHLFSATKVFTALAVMQLVDRGSLRLDDPVERWVPASPYGSDVTIDHLLSHTGGIPNPIPLAWIHLVAEDDAFDFDAFLERVLAAHPKRLFAPGSRWSYSNIGFMLLGKAIEAASGQRYRDYIRSHALAPLGLGPAQIDFRTDSMPSHATAYLTRLSFLTIAASFTIDMKKFGAPALGKWLPLRPFYLDGSPYGGLIANPAAAIAFLRELSSDESRLISVQSKRLLFEPQRTKEGKLTGMTRGWFAGKLGAVPYLTHPGGGGGYYCELRLYPTLAIASVVLFNRTGINERFLDTVDRFFIAQPR